MNTSLFRLLSDLIGKVTNPPRWLPLAASVLAAIPSLMAGQSGDFTYAHNDTHITITGYTGEGGVVAFPGQIAGLPVTTIDNSVLPYQLPPSSIFIPSSVTTIALFAFDVPAVTEISVDAANTNYSSVGGVLFDKSGDKLISYPPGKAGTYVVPSSVTQIGSHSFFNVPALTGITIPTGVKSIGNSAFAYCDGLTNVHIPVSVLTMGDRPFGGCRNLDAFEVDAANPNFGSADGVLFNKARTTVIQYPAHKGGIYTVPATVTNIATYAFSNSSLPGVVLPAALKEIASNSFFACPLLASVSIPRNVSSIGYNAFGACSNLKSISVDEENTSYSSVSGVLFNKTGTDLIQYPIGRPDSYTIPTGVRTIGYMAFAGCPGLTAITIPASVTSIAHYAFDSCSNLTSATFAGNAPEMGSSVFSGSWFFSVYYHNSATGFSSPTWQGYPAVRLGGYGPPLSDSMDDPSLAFSSGGNSPWSGQTTATKDGIDAAASGDIGNDQESWIETTVTGPGTLSFWWSVSSEANYDWLEFHVDGVLQPGRISGDVPWQQKILTIGAGSHVLRWRYIKDGIADGGMDTGWIDQVAWTPAGGDPRDFVASFEGGAATITGYTGNGGAVVVPAFLNGMPVTAIGAYAFHSKISITGLTLPAGISRIENDAFGFCSDLASLNLPAGLTTIGDRAFAYCGSLAGISIPASVASIGDRVFVHGKSMADITVDSGNPTYASLEGVLFNKPLSRLIAYPAWKRGAYYMPSQVTGIANGAFEGCPYLTGVSLPSGLENIGANAFHSCPALTHISIPNTVVTIGRNAFAACVTLGAIDVAAANGYYSSAYGVLFNKAKTLLIQYPAGKNGGYLVPASVTEIGPDSFLQCSRLTSINFPEGLKTIGNFAFAFCSSLPDLTFPTSLRNMGDYAFYNCETLAVVTFTSDAPDMGDEVFDNAADKFSVYHTSPSSGFSTPSWHGYPTRPQPWITFDGVPGGPGIKSAYQSRGVILHNVETRPEFPGRGLPWGYGLFPSTYQLFGNPMIIRAAPGTFFTNVKLRATSAYGSVCYAYNGPLSYAGGYNHGPPSPLGSDPFIPVPGLSVVGRFHLSDSFPEYDLTEIDLTDSGRINFITIGENTNFNWVLGVDDFRFTPVVDPNYIPTRDDVLITMRKVTAEAVSNMYGPDVDAPVAPVTTPVVLARQPKITSGLVADGVTPLLFDLNCLLAGRTTELKISVESPDSPDLNNRLRILNSAGNWQTADSGALVSTGDGTLNFAYLSGVDAEAVIPAGKSKITATLTVKRRSDDTVMGVLGFEIRRPPVVLVHGYNSDAGAWSDDFLVVMKGLVGSDFVLPITYAPKEENTKGRFDAMARALDRTLIAEVEGSGGRWREWAFTRYDLVGHSQGGVLSRMLCQTWSDAEGWGKAYSVFSSRKFRSESNLHRGRFRRVITIGSPHNGSVFAYYLSKLASNPDADHSYWIIPAITQLKGLLQDKFDPFGEQIRQINNPRYPVDPGAKFHLITTTIANGEIPLGGIWPPCYGLVGLYGPSVTLLGSRGSAIMPNASDGVVDLESQKAGKTGSNITHFQNISHSPFNIVLNGGLTSLFGLPERNSQTNDPLISTQVAALLQGGKNSFSEFGSLPKLLGDARKQAIDDELPEDAILELIRLEMIQENDTGFLRSVRSARSSQTRYRYELAKTIADPPVGTVFWEARVFGSNGITEEGVELSPDPSGSSVGTITVDSSIRGTVVLYATYNSISGKLVRANPVIVSSNSAGALLTGIELRPGAISRPTGGELFLEVWGVYDDGVKTMEYISPAESLEFSSSDPTVAMVGGDGVARLIRAGNVSISVAFKGFTARSDITVTDNDSDMDGMPDSWEFTHALDPDTDDADTDADGDGAKNSSEYIAGTDPGSSLSTFSITSLRRDANNRLTIHWPAVTGKSYCVSVSGDMKNWHPRISLPPSTVTGTLSAEVDTGGVPDFFIRVEVIQK